MVIHNNDHKQKCKFQNIVYHGDHNEQSCKLN
jgi:hypothetical protein